MKVKSPEEVRAIALAEIAIYMEELKKARVAGSFERTQGLLNTLHGIFVLSFAIGAITSLEWHDMSGEAEGKV